MKKLFILAMIVLGTSLAQAQDNSLVVSRFSLGTDTFLHVVDDYNPCYMDYTVSSYVKYSLSSDGTSLTTTDVDGNAVTRTIAGFARPALATLFGANYSYIRQVNSDGTSRIGGSVHDDQAKN